MKRLHLFRAYGIELEYMIVDRNTLNILPLSDELLQMVLGVIDNDYVNGRITWSNELVLHVIELKTSLPESNLVEVEALMHDNISEINRILFLKKDAMLLPTGMHPLMQPLMETKLWPYGYNAVYETYDRIFNCKGHGWSNVQSMHINLPFYDDEEFSQLHDAVRIVLPLIPALAASTPVVEGKVTGNVDQRLVFYKQNQAAIPVIAGHIIPELVHSKRQYSQLIYKEIAQAIAPFDDEKVLDPIWVNSRGAIARFDRGSIEIRLIDIQECPKADLAIASFITELIKWLDRKRVDGHNLKAARLAKVLNQCIQKGQQAIIDDLDYLDCYGLDKAVSAKDLLIHIFSKLKSAIPGAFHHPLQIMLEEGNLSERIIKTLGNEPDVDKIKIIYRHLAGCLAENKMFLPDHTHVSSEGSSLNNGIKL